MSGEITFYFKNGIIDYCRTSESYTKDEIKARTETKKKIVKIIAKYPKT